MMQWRVAVGFSQYLVSEYGDVRRIQGSRTRAAGHRLRGSIDSDGYLTYHLLTDDGGKRNVKAHVLVALTFIGPPPTPAHEVAHENGSRVAHHFTNLRWDTRAGNHADLQLHGTSLKGERNGRATLTEDEARHILSLRNTAPATVIARRLGLSYTVVNNILCGRTWKHLDRRSSTLTEEDVRRAGH